MRCEVLHGLGTGAAPNRFMLSISYKEHVTMKYTNLVESVVNMARYELVKKRQTKLMFFSKMKK